jgi:hypothetical protein
MAEIKSRENNPLPGINYSEIRIPDEQNLGTGTFTTVLEPDAMAKISPIVSSIVNKPVFKLLVNIHLATKEITALLGKANNTPALSREVFKMPEKINFSDKHSFKVIFKDWKIKELKMNRKRLEKVTE